MNGHIFWDATIQPTMATTHLDERKSIDWDPERQAKFANRGRKRRKKRSGPFQELLRSIAALPSLVLSEEPEATKSRAQAT